MEKKTGLVGCYLLIVLGEPLCEDHKERILQKVAKGLLSWDTKETDCDLKHMEDVCRKITSSKNSAENDILVQHSTDKMAVEVLLNPQLFTLKQCLKNLLLAPTGHKHLIHAGYSFTGSGSWMLHDGIFKFQDFADAFEDKEVESFLQKLPRLVSVHVHCAPVGEWVTTNYQTQKFSKLANVQLNPSDSSVGVQGAAALLDFFEVSLKSLNVDSEMHSSQIVGNIRFNRPTLYVFPSGQGDCCLFGVTGFTMLIDGGFTPLPCFWNFVRHLERLDSIMVTRLNESNLWGVSSFFRKKVLQPIYPHIGYIFCNITEGKASPTDEMLKDRNELLVSVIDIGQKMLGDLKTVGISPHQCLREPCITPLTLYHKVGHGTLDMFILSPPRESRILRDFLQQWSTNKESFSFVRTSSASQSGQDIAIPISHVMSICCLLIWKPAEPNENITRMLFPGSAPQSRIFEGLEKIKHLDVLCYPVCSRSSLRPAVVGKPQPKSSADVAYKAVPRFRSVSPLQRKIKTAKQASVESNKGDSSESLSSPLHKKLQQSKNVTQPRKEICEDKKAIESIDKRSKTDEKTIKKVEKSAVHKSPVRKAKPKTTIKSVKKTEHLKKLPQKPETIHKEVKNKYTEEKDFDNKDIDSLEEEKKDSEKESPEPSPKKQLFADSSKDDNEEVLQITMTEEISNEAVDEIDSHDFHSIEEEKKDSEKGSEQASPKKSILPDHLRDEIEPDSLESYDHDGDGDISKDSLELSETDERRVSTEKVDDIDQSSDSSPTPTINTCIASDLRDERLETSVSSTIVSDDSRIETVDIASTVSSEISDEKLKKMISHTTDVISETKPICDSPIEERLKDNDSTISIENHSKDDELRKDSLRGSKHGEPITSTAVRRRSSEHIAKHETSVVDESDITEALGMPCDISETHTSPVLSEVSNEKIQISHRAELMAESKPLSDNDSTKSAENEQEYSITEEKPSKYLSDLSKTDEGIVSADVRIHSVDLGDKHETVFEESHSVEATRTTDPSETFTALSEKSDEKMQISHTTEMISDTSDDEKSKDQKSRKFSEDNSKEDEELSKVRLRVSETEKQVSITDNKDLQEEQLQDPTQVSVDVKKHSIDHGDKHETVVEDSGSVEAAGMGSDTCETHAYSLKFEKDYEKMISQTTEEISETKSISDTSDDEKSKDQKSRKFSEDNSKEDEELSRDQLHVSENQKQVSVIDYSDTQDQLQDTSKVCEDIRKYSIDRGDKRETVVEDSGSVEAIGMDSVTSEPHASPVVSEICDEKIQVSHSTETLSETKPIRETSTEERLKEHDSAKSIENDSREGSLHGSKTDKPTTSSDVRRRSSEHITKHETSAVEKSDIIKEVPCLEQEQLPGTIQISEDITKHSSNLGIKHETVVEESGSVEAIGMSSVTSETHAFPVLSEIRDEKIEILHTTDVMSETEPTPDNSATFKNLGSTKSTVKEERCSKKDEELGNDPIHISETDGERSNEEITEISSVGTRIASEVINERLEASHFMAIGNENNRDITSEIISHETLENDKQENISQLQQQPDFDNKDVDSLEEEKKDSEKEFPEPSPKKQLVDHGKKLETSVVEKSDSIKALEMSSGTSETQASPVLSEICDEKINISHTTEVMDESKPMRDNDSTKTVEKGEEYLITEEKPSKDPSDVSMTDEEIVSTDIKRYSIDIANKREIDAEESTGMANDTCETRTSIVKFVKDDEKLISQTSEEISEASVDDKSKDQNSKKFSEDNSKENEGFSKDQLHVSETEKQVSIIDNKDLQEEQLQDTSKVSEDIRKHSIDHGDNHETVVADSDSFQALEMSNVTSETHTSPVLSETCHENVQMSQTTQVIRDTSVEEKLKYHDLTKSIENDSKEDSLHGSKADEPITSTIIRRRSSEHVAKHETSVEKPDIIEDKPCLRKEQVEDTTQVSEDTEKQSIYHGEKRETVVEESGPAEAIEMASDTCGTHTSSETSAEKMNISQTIAVIGETKSKSDTSVDDSKKFIEDDSKENERLSKDQPQILETEKLIPIIDNNDIQEREDTTQVSVDVRKHSIDHGLKHETVVEDSDSVQQLGMSGNTSETHASTVLSEVSNERISHTTELMAECKPLSDNDSTKSAEKEQEYSITEEKPRKDLSDLSKTDEGIVSADVRIHSVDLGDKHEAVVEESRSVEATGMAGDTCETCETHTYSVKLEKDGEKMISQPTEEISDTSDDEKSKDQKSRKFSEDNSKEDEGLSENQLHVSKTEKQVSITDNKNLQEQLQETTQFSADIRKYSIDRGDKRETVVEDSGSVEAIVIDSVTSETHVSPVVSEIYDEKIQVSHSTETLSETKPIRDTFTEERLKEHDSAKSIENDSNQEKELSKHSLYGSESDEPKTSSDVRRRSSEHVAEHETSFAEKSDLIEESREKTLEIPYMVQEKVQDTTQVSADVMKHSIDHGGKLETSVKKSDSIKAFEISSGTFETHASPVLSEICDEKIEISHTTEVVTERTPIADNDLKKSVEKVEEYSITEEKPSKDQSVVSKTGERIVSTDVRIHSIDLGDKRETVVEDSGPVEAIGMTSDSCENQTYTVLSEKSDEEMHISKTTEVISETKSISDTSDDEKSKDEKSRKFSEDNSKENEGFSKDQLHVSETEKQVSIIDNKDMQEQLKDPTQVSVDVRKHSIGGKHETVVVDSGEAFGMFSVTSETHASPVVSEIGDEKIQISHSTEVMSETKPIRDTSTKERLKEHDSAKSIENDSNQEKELSKHSLHGSKRDEPTTTTDIRRRSSDIASTVSSEISDEKLQKMISHTTDVMSETKPICDSPIEERLKYKDSTKSIENYSKDDEELSKDSLHSSKADEPTNSTDIRRRSSEHIAKHETSVVEKSDITEALRMPCDISEAHNSTVISEVSDGKIQISHTTEAMSEVKPIHDKPVDETFRDMGSTKSNEKDERYLTKYEWFSKDPLHASENDGERASIEKTIEKLSVSTHKASEGLNERLETSLSITIGTESNRDKTDDITSHETLEKANEENISQLQQQPMHETTLVPVEIHGSSREDNKVYFEKSVSVEKRRISDGSSPEQSSEVLTEKVQPSLLSQPTPSGSKTQEECNEEVIAKVIKKTITSFEKGGYFETIESEEDEEMIRHPTPPDDKDFYEKVGFAAGSSELTRLPSNDMPSVHLRRSSLMADEVLYEKPEDEDSSYSDGAREQSSPADEPYFAKISAEYAEMINVSGGTTPSTTSEPQSPYDPKSVSRGGSLKRNEHISVIKETQSTESETLPESDSVKEYSDVVKESQIVVGERVEVIGQCLKTEVDEPPLIQGSSQTIETVSSTVRSTTSVSSVELPVQSQTSDEQVKKTLEEWGKPLGLPTLPETANRNASKTRASSAVRYSKTSIDAPKYQSSKQSLRYGKDASNESQEKPVYLDLAYVPHHGDMNYCNADFFKKVRARFYVFSATNPSKEVFDALIDGKKCWENKEAEVTVIPTHETETLSLWMSAKHDLLEKYRIDVAPSASRCTVTLQDHETTCAAYRLEF